MPVTVESLQHQIARLYQPVPMPGHWRRRIHRLLTDWTGRDDLRLFWTPEEEDQDRSAEKYMLYGRSSPPRYIGFGRRLLENESQIVALLVPHLERVADLMEFVTQPTAGSLPPRWLQSLTPRQLEVAVLVSAGLTNKQAAEHLSVTPRTIANVLAEIFQRLALVSRHELAPELVRHRAGLSSPPPPPS